MFFVRALCFLLLQAITWEDALRGRSSDSSFPKARRRREPRAGRELDAEGLRRWGASSRQRGGKKSYLHPLLKEMGRLLLILTSPWATGALTSSFPSCPFFLLRLACGGCSSLRLKRKNKLYGIWCGSSKYFDIWRMPAGSQASCWWRRGQNECPVPFCAACDS